MYQRELAQNKDFDFVIVSQVFRCFYIVIPKTLCKLKKYFQKWCPFGLVGSSDPDELATSTRYIQRENWSANDKMKFYPKNSLCIWWVLIGNIYFNAYSTLHFEH